MNDKQLTILAAAMARSNLGYEFPDIGDLSRLLKREAVSLVDAVLFFCQSYMENDEHYDLFMQEALGWKKRLAKRTEQDIQSAWPDKYKIFRNAMEA